MVLQNKNKSLGQRKRDKKLIDEMIKDEKLGAKLLKKNRFLEKKLDSFESSQSVLY